MTATISCEWTTDRVGSHPGYHHGYPCPIERIIAIDSGRPDPAELVAEWRIDLPFTAGKPPLSMNGRYHWAVKAKLTELTKAITRNAIRAADVPELGSVHVEMHHRPATNRFRDIDNFTATLKPVIDAMHQPDDRSLWVPIIPGDDPRYVSWSPPVLHPWQRGLSAATWLILRTYQGPEMIPVQEAML